MKVYLVAQLINNEWKTSSIFKDKQGAEKFIQKKVEEATKLGISRRFKIDEWMAR